MKISFDFDSTLSEPHIQKLAKVLVDAGMDIWVLTSRQDDFFKDEHGKNIGYIGHNYDLREVMKEVGIPKHKVIYTNGALKQGEYARGGFDLHFDDMWDEVEEINKQGGHAIMVDMRIGDVLFLMNYEEIDKFRNEEGLSKEDR